jgi:hypothetical protein
MKQVTAMAEFTDGVDSAPRSPRTSEQLSADDTDLQADWQRSVRLCPKGCVRMVLTQASCGWPTGRHRLTLG